MRLWEFIVNLTALLIFVAMLLSSWLGHSWGDDIIELAFGFGGTVICLFPYEATSYSGHWGWSHRQWRIPPEGWIKFCGIVALLLGAFSIFTGSEWLDRMIRR